MIIAMSSVNASGVYNVYINISLLIYYEQQELLSKLDDVKKSSILKNGIGIEGQKSTQTSKKYGSK